MNRLFCWLLLAAILVEKGECNFGLEDFGLWVVFATHYTQIWRLCTCRFCLQTFHSVCVLPVHKIFVVVEICFGFEAADRLVFMWNGELFINGTHGFRAWILLLLVVLYRRLYRLSFV